MRITLDLLQKYTAQYIERRVQQEHGIVSVFLTGSLLKGDALWCETPDIDLVFVHSFPPDTPREVIPLVGDVHLDIYHYDRQAYEPARQVRTDALLGPLVYAARSMYDPMHFFDFIQASVRSQYDRPEFVHRRAAPALEQARQGWFALQGEAFSPAFMEAYLQCIENTACGLAALGGETLSPRRFALSYREAVRELGREGLFSGFLGLLGGTQGGDTAEWLSAWEETWRGVMEGEGASEWAAPRLAYFRSGMRKLLQGEVPQAALWPLLTTWTRLVRAGGESAPWEAACRALGLSDPEERLAALDAYLDAAEETLDHWARANGVA